MDDHDQDAGPDLDPENFVRPTQQSLDVITRGIQRVDVCDWESVGSSLEPRVLLTLDDMARVQELLSHLRIVESDDFFHCMCVGSLLLQLFAREGLVATLTLHHGLLIRWDDVWGSDARLEDGRAMAVWLAEQGVPSLLEEVQSGERQAADAERVFTAWFEAMPACLKPLYEPQIQWAHLQPAERMLTALREEYFVDAGLVLALCEWHGTLGRSWGGDYLFEQLVDHLLDQLGRERVVRALEGVDLDSRQAEGVARYLYLGARMGEMSPATVKVLRACSAALEDSAKAEEIRRLIAGA